MFGGVIAGILKLLAGDAGATIGRGLSIAAAVAAIYPVATTALGHKDEIAVQLTWGQLALFAGFAWSIVEVARRARAPMMFAAAAAGVLALAIAPAPAIAAAVADPLEQLRDLMRLVAWLQAGGLTALLWFVWFQWKLERRVYTLELHTGLIDVHQERS